MKERETLQSRQDRLRREREQLKAALQAAERGQRRQLQVRLAVTEEELIDCQDALRRLGRASRPAGKRTDHEPASSSLKELARSYRAEMEVLRGRIQLVSGSPLELGETPIQREDRLRILKAMYRDVRAVAVLCERYYDRSYARDERYVI